MKVQLFAMVLVAFIAGSAFASNAKKHDRKPNSESSVVVKGKLANQIFDAVSSDESDCGMGKCWAEGKVSCQRSNETGKTECTFSPLSENK